MSADALLDWLGQIGPTYPWGGRRGVDRIRTGLEHQFLRKTYQHALADPRAHLEVEHVRGNPIASTIRTPKPLESESFGVETASLSHVVCASQVVRRGQVVESLLDAARRHAAADGVELLILRVDADDVQTLAAAQNAGFSVCEATMTWLADSAAATSAAPPASDITVEVHEGDVTGALDPAEIEQLAESTASWQLNHFRADTQLPRAAVDRFYARWVDNIASGEWSDCLFVARHRGRIIGVESEYTDRELLRHTGTDVRVGEWIVVLEPGLGAGSALMSAAGRHRSPGGRFHSWETQLRNSATIRCIERTGVAAPLRAAYTLHAWPSSR